MSEVPVLKVIRAQPNPMGMAGAQLFLFQGDATRGRVSEVVPAPDVTLPEKRDDLDDAVFRLKVVHINDLHGHIIRFQTDPGIPVFSRIVHRLRRLRTQARETENMAVLALSAGDDLVGTVLDELLGEDPASYEMHAGYHLYSAAGIDASAIGNHDLDMGSELLSHAIRTDAQFPILSANLTGSRYLQDAYYPAALFVVKGVRIGIIGLSTPAAIRPQADAGLHVVNPVQAAHNILPAIRPLSDVLIILSHLGYDLQSTTGSVSEAGDVELAQSLPPGSVQLIVGGHTHHVLNEQGLTANNIVNGIPIVQAGTLGTFVGEVDIMLRNGCSAVTNARLTPTANLEVDREFEEESVQPIVRKTEPYFVQPLGIVDDHPDLTTDAVRNLFSSEESALANFITDALVYRTRANGYNVDFAAIDTSCIRCGLPVGQELVFSDWFRLMPFPDAIRLCWLTGRQLQELLDDNARRADRPDEPHTERGFLQFSQHIRYTIERGQTRATAHAIDLTLNGRSIEEQWERSFLMACSNFTRRPARSWEAFARRYYEPRIFDLTQLPHLDPHLFLRNELVTYIKENGGVTKEGGARRDGRVRFI
ncbi:MAG: bifunctional metallophosphatase/5'-nucleotidase [Chloroflexota bacterium]